MANRAIHFSILFTLFLALSLSTSEIMQANNGISLYTPYVKISVPPGESVDYSIDVKNSSNETKNVEILLSGLPKDWDYTLKAGGFDINQISVQPGERRTLALKVNVPLKVNKGIHQFKVLARNYDALPLVINVSTQGSFKTEFTSEQINMQGHAKENFTFTTKLKNETGEMQEYSLQATPPRGWNVIFKPNYKQATAVEIEPNVTSNISIEITPPFNIEAGTYKIPVYASNRSTTGSLILEVVITGTFDMELTTPSGLLSYDITAGNKKQIELAIVNTGSSELENIVFRSANPAKWEVTFKPDTLTLLKAGETAQVFAVVKAYEKAIPGDYVTTITAQTKEVSSKASFRISVKTPLLWGWVGILIILAVLGIIFYLFRKYGRR